MGLKQQRKARHEQALAGFTRGNPPQRHDIRKSTTIIYSLPAVKGPRPPRRRKVVEGGVRQKQEEREGEGRSVNHRAARPPAPPSPPMRLRHPSAPPRCSLITSQCTRSNDHFTPRVNTSLNAWHCTTSAFVAEGDAFAEGALYLREAVQSRYKRTCYMEFCTLRCTEMEAKQKKHSLGATSILF
jgi:hypothetical protein